MIPGIVAASGGAGGGEPIVITEPWEQIAVQDTIADGKLTIAGLNLSNLIAAQLLVTGLQATDDDSQVFLRWIIDGVEHTGADYVWTLYGPGVTVPETAISLTPTAAGSKLGNATTESLDAVVTVYPLHGTLSKLCYITGSLLKPDGTLDLTQYGGGRLVASGSITGCVVYASSALVAGSLALMGID